ncbi:hypothetical protein [Streptomyces dysideae]|uniref:hypothetical protein n=1 Tax=Streptomyces dysideae TaxID=909626 RepID=UPI000A9271AE|nr:hypothetical protein [Streptomyces dysideae]
MDAVVIQDGPVIRARYGAHAAVAHGPLPRGAARPTLRAAASALPPDWRRRSPPTTC